jgi:alpha-tubulin suppressor-like RCC1 family protein
MNSAQQLGVGAVPYSTGPALVEGGRAFVAITAGAEHTCGLTAVGQAHCWGGSARGDPDGFVFTSISAGSYRTCGLASDGVAYCWGEEISGRDWGGRGASSNSTPVAIAGGASFVELDVGDAHSCGLTADDGVYCWGHNERGQLGDGMPLGWMAREVVTAQFSHVVTGQQHSCGLSSGSVYCWGDGEWGQLGTGSRDRSAVPVAVPGLVNVTRLSTDGHRICALTQAGDAYCWGEIVFDPVNYHPLFVLTPARVAGGPFVELAVGRFHTCALTAQGAAFCWGDNWHGQLGQGQTVPNSVTPLPVPGGITFRSLSAGGYHTCGVSLDGPTWCWGFNFDGELGDGTFDAGTGPRKVVGGHLFIALSAGARHTCGLTASGAAYCWGNNDRGSLGVGHDNVGGYPAPQEVSSGIRFATISAGQTYSCGVSTSGIGYCWGSNWWGRFATDVRIDAFPSPLRLDVPTPLVQIATGSYHACGLTPSGTAYCWGEIHHGQLGRGYFGYRLSAAVVRPYPR